MGGVPGGSAGLSLRRPGHRALVAAALAGTLAVSSGCIATSWRPRESYARTRQTLLVANSTPPATIYVNGQEMGQTPLHLPLFYSVMANRSTRDVTLWMSQPGLATALTLMSGGAYLPSSLVPVATESRVEDGKFENNSFQVRLEAPGFPVWQGTLDLTGEPERTIDVNLAAAAPGEPPYEPPPPGAQPPDPEP